MNIAIAPFAGFVALVLASLPVAALSTAAHAANASVPYAAQSVRIGDLNLASASGKAMLTQRADTAARRFCVSERNLDAKAACQSGVRDEVSQKAAAGVRFASRL